MKTSVSRLLLSVLELIFFVEHRSNTIMSDSEFESSCPEESDNSSSSPPKKKFKPNVLHENVEVKVDGKIYRMNRFQLALKSNYFETLFVGDFAEKNNDVVELRGLNSDTFSAIIDLINGKDLKSVMNPDNYSALFVGMDYLQMEIDLTLVESFIGKGNVVKVIELYNVMTMNQNYQYLEKKVLKSVSANLVEIFKNDEKSILSLPFEGFFKIIRKGNVMEREFLDWPTHPTVDAKQTLSRICSKWIFHDVENRLQHFPEIVNAANYGFYTYSFLIPNEKVEALLDEIKKDTSLEQIEKCFQVLLNYRGEINPDVGQSRLKKKSVRKHHIVNKIDESQKITRFLNEGHLSDVTIKVGAKTYKLHRYVLDTASSYFSALISPSDKNSELVLDVDENTFDLIVDFIYFDEIPEFDSNSKEVVLQILKVAAILKSKLVIEKCCVPWFKQFQQTLNAEDFVELLNSAVGSNCQFESWVTDILKTHIYRLTNSGICKDLFRLWQICDAAGIDQLILCFREAITLRLDRMEYEDGLKVFNVICEVKDGKFSYIYIACLCKLIVAPKPKSSVESHFLSVSCNVLEDLLASRYFIIENPQKIVDICSKWIAHDVQNRYRLIPRIVFAINRNNSMDFSDFEANIPADLSNCSQKTVDDELWKLLNSNCLLSRELESKQTIWDFKSRPMFILPKNIDQDTRMPKKICIVDSELNEMVSLNFLLGHYDVPPKRDRLMMPKLSATIIGDTLFVLCEIRCEFNVYAYNFSSKKLNVLGPGHRSMRYPMDTLLNCCNQLFWCFDDGRVMRYSIELNRWLKLYSDPESRNHGPYASDGNKLFRYKKTESILQTFDFNRSSWTHFVNLPSYPQLHNNHPIHLTNFHEGLAFVYRPMFDNFMLLFYSDTRSWKIISTSNNSTASFSFGLGIPTGMFQFGVEFNAELASYGDGLLFAQKTGIRHLPRSSFSSGRWQMKKKAQSDSEFEGIVAIHSTS